MKEKKTVTSYNCREYFLTAGSLRSLLEVRAVSSTWAFISWKKNERIDELFVNEWCKKRKEAFRLSRLIDLCVYHCFISLCRFVRSFSLFLLYPLSLARINERIDTWRDGVLQIKNTIQVLETLEKESYSHYYIISCTFIYELYFVAYKCKFSLFIINLWGISSEIKKIR